MKRSNALRLLPAVVAIAMSIPLRTAHAAFPPSRPNVLYIMSDDYGWPFYGFMDAIAELPVPAARARHPQLRVPTIDGVSLTPGLDRLARRGLMFPRARSADSVCVPSFRSSQSGLHQKDHDLIQGPTSLIGGYLDQLGYDSFALGKSWIGFGALGFNCAPECETEWSVGREQITPILDFVSQNRPPNVPWFVFYSPHLPHAPHDARKWVDRTCAACTGADACPLGADTSSGHPAMVLPTAYFAQSALCEKLGDLQRRMASIACFTEIDCTAQPPTVPSGCPWTVAELCGNGAVDDFEYLRLNGAKYEQYYGNILLADFWIGLLLDFLGSPAGSPIGHNTLILYQTDNGRIPGSRMNDDQPASKWKKSSRENGFRTPILASLPSVLSSNENGSLDASRVSAALVHAVDLLPTILDLGSGAAVPVCAFGTRPSLPEWDETASGGQGDWKAASGPGAPCLEGRSLKEHLEQDPPTPRPLGFNLKNGKTFIVTDDGFRVFRKNCSKYLLYDLDADPDEEVDKHDVVDGGGELRGGAMCHDRLDYLKTVLECWHHKGCATPGTCATLANPPTSGLEKCS